MSITAAIEKHRAAGRGRTFLIAIAIAAAVSAIAAAQGFGDASRMTRWHRGGSESIETVRQALANGAPWLDLMAIRDDQRTALLQIVERHGPALRQLESERNRLMGEFASAFGADVVDVGEMDRLHGDLRTLGTAALDESAVLMTEAAKILTPEQRAHLVALIRHR